MQLNSEVLDRVVFLCGSADTYARLPDISAKRPFDESIVDFLNDLSRTIMKNRAAKVYSDVVTFAFWIRKTSVMKLKERFEISDNNIHMGKGVVFHIAPSNVPVNFAYSLAAGLLTGNANIVRVPGKEFPQVDIVIEAISDVLKQHESMRPYIMLVRYERDKGINDFFSSIADVRVVWGGDQTIAELRKSPLPPRSGEITFADRYSFAFIDSDFYLDFEDKDRVAEDFYNDTFFSDQNACTSPRLVIWTGSRIEEAKKIFWEKEHALAADKYTFQAVQSVNKLTSSYLMAAAEPGVKIEEHKDNLIVRVRVPKISEYLIDYRDNSGYFYEYDCRNIMEIRDLCNDKRCQTIAYIGDVKTLLPVIESDVKGIDRIVPMGKTMDFDLIWDGYDLPALLTRTVVLNI